MKDSPVLGSTPWFPVLRLNPSTSAASATWSLKAAGMLGIQLYLPM